MTSCLPATLLTQTDEHFFSFKDYFSPLQNNPFSFVSFYNQHPFIFIFNKENML